MKLSSPRFSYIRGIFTVVVTILATSSYLYSKSDNVNKLIRQLGHKKPEVRENAAEALGELTSPLAIEPLIGTLGDAEEPVREAASEALVKTGKPAVEPLIDALDDDNWRVRKNAMYVLGEIGDVRASLPLLAEMRKTENEFYMRDAAASALGSIGDVAIADTLISDLGSSDPMIRQLAAMALGISGNGKVVEPLIEALKDEDIYVRSNAAGSLGKVGDARAIDPLLEAALRPGEVDEFIPVAVLAVGEIGNEAAIEPLIEILKNHRWQSVGEALTMLTGQDFRTDYKGWNAWWEENKETFEAPE